jgi:phenylpropionate dioxygenase-like ring-hydroxylating dioxygenase large terminal subunit
MTTARLRRRHKLSAFKLDEALMTLSLDVDQLVQSERGLISRELFVNEELFQEELTKVFTRAWLFVGHESLIPNPNDFYTSRMGDESVILSRDSTGKIHVFLNSCRHRGMKVCRYEQGNTTLFVCPYHSWSYKTDGRLLGVPMYKTLYEGTLDRAEWSLIEVGKLVNYRSTIWATWDKNAPDFVDYLGDMKEHLDLALDCRDGRPGGSEVIGVQKWVLPANWKFGAENFLGDTYHNPSHQSVDLIGIGPSAGAGKRGRRDDQYKKATHVWVSFPAGHGVHSALQAEDNEYVESYLDYPQIEEYFRHCFEERKRQLGEKSRLLPAVGTVFPNASYLGLQPRGICVWHPNSATSTEAWRFYLVDKDAPQEVKQFLRSYYMRYSGPAGMTEQDDIENWLYATSASRGTIARRYPFNYQQSLHVAKMNDPVPGEVSTQISEHIARGFYHRWASYLKEAPWDELLGKNDGNGRASAA